MIRGFLFLFLFLLNACIIVWEEDPPGRSDQRTTPAPFDYLWIEEAQVGCGSLGWSFDVFVGASYFYDSDEVEVAAYAEGWDYHPLFYVGGDRWQALHTSYYYDCDDIVSFVIVATDEYGSSDTVTLWW